MCWCMTQTHCVPPDATADLTYYQTSVSEVYHSPILHHVLLDLKGLEPGTTVFYSVGELGGCAGKRPPPSSNRMECAPRPSHPHHPPTPPPVPPRRRGTRGERGAVVHHAAPGLPAAAGHRGGHGPGVRTGLSCWEVQACCSLGEGQGGQSRRRRLHRILARRPCIPHLLQHATSHPPIPRPPTRLPRWTS